MRIAVVSDIHAAVPDDKGVAASYCSTAPSLESPTRDALLSLEELIKSEQVTADFLVCCGDMTNQANPTAMNYVWTQFNRLAALLSATPFATVGNHDLDSRFAHNEFDSRGALRALRPPYPISNLSLNYEYWSRNFVVIEEGDLRLVILNSCAYHGFNPDRDSPEYLHGRIAKYTLDDLRTTLNSSSSAARLSVLLCHHHPHRHQDIEDKDYSVMDGGERLIDMLGGAPGGPWLVLHGHKHQPRLIYAAGGGSAPIVFGAGSLSAKLHRDLQDHARNQFYILDVDFEEADSLELDLAGQIRAWDYMLGVGWIPARAASGLPARSGFGYRVQVRKDTQRLAALVTSNGGIVRWREVLSALPQLRYALPSDISALADKLARTHQIGLLRDENGLPIELAQK